MPDPKRRGGFEKELKEPQRIELHDPTRFYKASGFKVLKDAEGEPFSAPSPPDLETYQDRGPDE